MFLIVEIVESSVRYSVSDSVNCHVWPTALPRPATVDCRPTTVITNHSDAWDDNCDGVVRFISRITPTSRLSVLPFMPIDPPFNVYRDQLTSLYHGLALWNPNPPKTIYNHVSIGDVGYVREGLFIRMFNVILPWDHESNATLGEPEPYESLDCGPFTKILEVPLKTQEHYSRYVSAETNDSNAQAKEPDK